MTGVLSGRPPVLLATAATVAAAVAALPPVYLVVRAAGAGPAGILDALGGGRVAEYAVNTVLLTVAVTATALVLGTAGALVLTRIAVPGMRVWLLVSTLPLAVPSFLAAYGWLVVQPSLQGFVPSWMLLTAVTTPYVFLPVAAALRSASADPERVARTLGRGPVGAFLLATWPQVRPSAVAGALLVALYCLSDFGLVALLRFPTLTWGINAAYAAGFDRAQAATLSLLLVVLAVIVVAGERRARSRGPAPAPRVSVPRAMRPRDVPVVVVLLGAAPVVGVVVPLAGLAMSLAEAETLRALDVPRLVSAATAPVGLAVAAAVVAVVLALPVAAMAARYGGRFVGTVESVGYLGHAVPGIVVGLSLVFFTLAVVPVLYQTTIALVFAYVVLFMPKSIGTVRAGLAAVPTRLTAVARTLGCSPTGAWVRVTVPLALPSAGVGALLVAVATMKELPATLLLRPTGIDTLATELWSRTVVFQFGAAAPYAALLVLLAAVPAAVLSGVRGLARGES